MITPTLDLLALRDLDLTRVSVFKDIDLTSTHLHALDTTRNRKIRKHRHYLPHATLPTIVVLLVRYYLELRP